MNVVEQRLTALEKANRIRMMRAELKQEIRSLGTVDGKAVAAQAIEVPPNDIETMEVETLVIAIRHFGTRRTHRVMLDAGIPPKREIGRLTREQRKRLTTILREAR